MVVGLKSKPLDEVRSDVPVGVVTQEETARININVPISTRRLWKTAAAQEDSTLGDMITAAMKMYLSKKT